MGKPGPCHHCGARETPLWRHGPTEKPLLCNACGSRWRLKGTLDDYTPKRYRSVVRKRKFQNAIDVHEEEGIIDTGEVTLDMQYDYRVLPVKSSFAHIESLQRELYEMYIDQQCASTFAAPELIYDNLNGGLKQDNEIGLGVVMLNAPMVAKEEKSGSSPFMWKKNVLASHAEAKGEVFLKMDNIDSSQGVATPPAPADPKERYKSVAEAYLVCSSFAPGGDLLRHDSVSAGGAMKTKNKESIGKPVPGCSSIDDDVSCTGVGKESMPLKEKMTCLCFCSSSEPFD